MNQIKTGVVVLALGDDVSTDSIYPGRFMATVLPSETPQFAFADLKSFQDQVKSRTLPPGSVILARNNFGCGSSREQAVSCLRGHDLTIIARSIARIFLQNAINLGLSVILCPEVEGQEGDLLQISSDCVINQTRNRSFPMEPLPHARQVILEAGGLIPYTRKRLLQRQTFFGSGVV